MTRQYIGRRQWDNLHEGLLAGERLQFELAHMEKEYYDHNCREYELTDAYRSGSGAFRWNS